MSDDETGEKLIRLVEVIEDQDDVQNVYVNFSLSDALMEKMGAPERPLRRQGISRKRMAHNLSRGPDPACALCLAIAACPRRA